MKPSSIHKAGLLVFDIVVCLLAFWLSSGILAVVKVGGQLRPIPYEDFLFFFLFSFILATIFHFNHLYKYQFVIHFAPQFVQLVKSLLVGFGILVVISFLSKSPYVPHARLAVVMFFGCLFILFVILRCFLIPKVYRYFTEHLDVRKNTLIICAGEKGKKIIQDIDFLGKRNPYYRILGFLDDDEKKQGKVIIGNYKVLGKIDSLKDIIHTQKVDEVIVAIDAINYEDLLSIMDRCADAGIPVRTVSNHINVMRERWMLEEYGGLVVPMLKGGSKAGTANAVIKRVMDIFCAVMGLLLFLPFYFIFSILIKCSSRGPILYKRLAVGKNEKQFSFLKLRTMVDGKHQITHNEFMRKFIRGGKKEVGSYFIMNDNRVTRIGRFLRKYSFDEVPQFWNVLKGEMSIVGPRPCNTDEFQYYKPWHRRRFKAKPGITGLWQVAGRDEVDYDDMVVMDIYYTENQSFWLDLEILVKTIPVVLFKKAAK